MEKLFWFEQLPGEVLDEQRDVLGSVAERRDHHLDPVDSVEEVLAEPPRRHLPLEVAIRGADETEVGPSLAGRPDPVEGPRVEHAEELRLDLGRHLSDLVEEERPPVRDLDEPRLLVAGPGEGPALEAEQLALEQARRHRRAVEVHETLVRPGRQTVHVLGQQLLAHAALAFDQHRCARRRHHLDRLQDLLEQPASGSGCWTRGCAAPGSAAGGSPARAASSRPPSPPASRAPRSSGAWSGSRRRRGASSRWRTARWRSRSR